VVKWVVVLLSFILSLTVLQYQRTIFINLILQDYTTLVCVTYVVLVESEWSSCQGRGN